ncbi:MAG: YcgN family cysteine cluster protein [Pseudomonadota bacterium]
MAMDRFWETTPLDEMSPSQWEVLCDGCGKCCLIKLEDVETGELRYTNIACRLLDDRTCRCTNYPLRKQLVAGCVVLTPERLDEIAEWMPSTCAYKRLHEGDTLPDWHPLLSGSPHTVHAAGISVQNKTVPEYDVDEDDFEDYAIEGPF